MLRFVARPGVDQQDRHLVLEHVVQTSLVATNARVDVLGPDSRAFFTRCGSAKNGRAMLTMSAAPAANAASQSSAVLNRLVVTSGT